MSGHGVGSWKMLLMITNPTLLMFLRNADFTEFLGRLFGLRLALALAESDRDLLLLNKERFSCTLFIHRCHADAECLIGKGLDCSVSCGAHALLAMPLTSSQICWRFLSCQLKRTKLDWNVLRHRMLQTWLTTCSQSDTLAMIVNCFVLAASVMSTFCSSATPFLVFLHSSFTSLSSSYFPSWFSYCPPHSPPPPPSPLQSLSF